MNELRFFNPYADIRHTENRLPHWQQQSATYFVTFRLEDAVPMRLLKQWESEREAWLRVHPEPWTTEIEQEYYQRFSGAIDFKSPLLVQITAWRALRSGSLFARSRKELSILKLICRFSWA